MKDLIDRQAAIRLIRDKVSLSLFMKRSVDKADEACVELCDMLATALPSAQPERKKGKWIPSVDRWGGIITTVDGYTCSKCGSFNADKDNFCHNCGAYMRGDENED